jgi:hypothetical protein
VVRRALRSLGPGRRVFFAVIETTSVPPDQAVRRAFIKLFEEQAADLAMALVTIRGEGFRVAMVRTIVAGILTLMPRLRFPKHIGGSLEQAARVVADHVADIDSAGLLAAFGELAAQS